MFILETGFTILINIAAWNDYGPGWGDIETLSVFDWSWDPLPPLNGFCKSREAEFRNLIVCIRPTSGCNGTELLHLAHIQLDHQALGSRLNWMCK